MQETIMSKHNWQNIETFNGLRPISRTKECLNANLSEHYEAAYDGNSKLLNTNEVRECNVRQTRLDPRTEQHLRDKYAKYGELQNVNINHVVDDIIVIDDEPDNCSEERGEHGDAILNVFNSSDGVDCKDNRKNGKKPDNCSEDNGENGHVRFRVLNILDDFDYNDDKIKTEENDDSILEHIAISNSCSQEAPHVMAQTIPSHVSVGNQAVSACAVPAPRHETGQQTTNHISTFQAPYGPAAINGPHVETTNLRQRSHSKPFGQHSKKSKTNSSSFTQSTSKQPPAQQQCVRSIAPKTNSQDKQQTTQQLSINPVIQKLTQLVKSVSTNPLNPHQMLQRTAPITSTCTQTTTTKSAMNTCIETPMQHDVKSISTNQPMQSGKERSINQPMHIPETQDHPLLRCLFSTSVPTSVLHKSLIRLRKDHANKQQQQQTQQTCPLSGPDSKIQISYDGTSHMAHDFHQTVEARVPPLDGSAQTDCKKWIVIPKDHSHENPPDDVESEPSSGNCSDTSSPFPTFLPIRNISFRDCTENQNSTVNDDNDNSDNCRIEKKSAKQGSNKMLDAVSIKECEVRLVRLDPRKVHCKKDVDDKAIGGSNNESDFYADASQSSCDSNTIFDPISEKIDVQTKKVSDSAKVRCKIDHDFHGDRSNLSADRDNQSSCNDIEINASHSSCDDNSTFDPISDNNKNDSDVQTKKISDSRQTLGNGDKSNQKRDSSLTGEKQDPLWMLQMMLNRQEKVVQTKLNTKEEKSVHIDSQTETKATIDRETQVVIKTDDYDDMKRKEKKGTRKRTLKDSSNKNGKDYETKRRRATTKNISYNEMCSSDSDDSVHDPAWLMEREDEVQNSSSEDEIRQNDDVSKSYDQTRLSQNLTNVQICQRKVRSILPKQTEQETSNMLKMKKSNNKLPIENTIISQCLKYHAGHPDLQIEIMQSGSQVQTKKTSDSRQTLGNGDKSNQKRCNSLTGETQDPLRVLQMMLNRQEKVVQTEFNTKEEKDVHVDSQTETKATIDRESQVVIKTDDYGDMDRKEKRGACKRPLKDSSNENGKDTSKSYDQTRLSQNVTKVQKWQGKLRSILPKQMEQETSSMLKMKTSINKLPVENTIISQSLEYHAGHPDLRIEIMQSDDASKWWHNKSRLSQDGETSKMLQIKAAKKKQENTIDSQSLEYHAVHPGFRFDADQRRFAELLKQNLMAGTGAPVVCDVCGCAFANDDRFSHHLKLQKKVKETLDYKCLQHPQVMFHFIQQNGKQVTSPLVSINQNILGMANGTTSCNKDNQCRTTQKEPENARDEREPLADCTDGHDTGADGEFSCMLCSRMFRTLQEAVVHMGHFHLNHSAYLYCKAGCGVVLMDQYSHDRHLRAYHINTFSQQIESQAQVINSQRDCSVRVNEKYAQATHQESNTSGDRITTVNEDSVSEDTWKKSYRLSEHNGRNALNCKDTVCEQDLKGSEAKQARVPGSLSQHSTVLSHLGCERIASQANGLKKTDSSLLTNLLTGLQCTDCPSGPIFTTQLALCEHLWSTHKREDAYPCPVCGQLFSKFLGTHLLKAHAEYLPSTAQQDDNNYIYDTIPKDYRTMLTHSKCSLCNHVSHVTSEKRKEVLMFDSTRHLCRTLERTNLLTSKKRLECVVCDVSFASFFWQRVHMATYHVELHYSETQILAQVAIWLPVYKESTCPICQKSVKRNLKKHMTYHKKPVQCPKCNKSMLVESLPFHLKTQHGKLDLTIICEMCGKMCTNNSNLKRHQECVHPSQCSQEYKCPDCKETFRAKRYLQKHIRRKHQGIKPKKYTRKCSICDWTVTAYSTNSKRLLREHMTVHTGEKLYTCPLCKKKFNRFAALARHKRIHLEESPRYKCDVDGCGLAFTQTCSLKRHMLTHTNETPYLCQWCGKRFKQSYPLKQHVEKHHKEHLEEYLLQDPRRAVVRKN